MQSYKSRRRAHVAKAVLVCACEPPMCAHARWACGRIIITNTTHFAPVFVFKDKYRWANVITGMFYYVCSLSSTLCYCKNKTCCCFSQRRSSTYIALLASGSVAARVCLSLSKYIYALNLCLCFCCLSLVVIAMRQKHMSCCWVCGTSSRLGVRVSEQVAQRKSESTESIRLHHVLNIIMPSLAV